MKRIALAVLLLSAASSAFADEGMWPFDQVPVAAFTRAYGVTPSPEWIRHLQLASVRLGNGCSGSFVSPDGLVLTNHHCAQDAIVEHSTAKRDLLANGFLARTRAEELPCTALEITVLTGMEDVTARVAAATAGLADSAANEARKRTLSDLALAAERAARREPGGATVHCEAVTLYQGGQYMIYRYKRYTDVRLVFAPEYAAAVFGGDPDNFMFPRWCLDMSLLRVYENGQPAHPAHWLRVDPAGARAGDPVFVSGHPGRTARLLTVAQLERERDVTLPLKMLLGSELRGRYLQYSKQGDEEAREAMDPLLWVENSLRVHRKSLDALHDDSLMASKRRDEADLRAHLAADPALAAATGDPWVEIAAAQAKARDQELRHAMLEDRMGLRGAMFDFARKLVRAAAERAKPNGERLPEYAETALAAMEQEVGATVPVYPAIERLELSFGFERLREWLGPDDPVVRQVLGHDLPDTVAARLVAGTRLADAAYRRALWQGGAAAVDTCSDPMIAFARALDGESRAVRKRWETDVEAPVTRAAERLAHARFAVYGTKLYPDATFTLRLNGGRVAGWTSGGRAVAPFTTVGQAFERATGSDPLVMPPSWLAARAKLDPSTRYNLSSTNDTVGGNSGSPVVNRSGDLVGLLFDGNIESIAGAYWFDARVNRSVAVDVDVMRAALTTVYGADALAREMGLAK